MRFQSDDEEDEEKKALKQHTQQNEQLVVTDDKDDIVVSKISENKSAFLKSNKNDYKMIHSANLLCNLLLYKIF